MKTKKIIKNPLILRANKCIDNNDTLIFIDPDDNDLNLVINEVLSLFKEKLPNENFSIEAKRKNQILIFIIKKITSTINGDGKILNKEIIVDELYMNDIIKNFLTTTTKNNLLKKYEFQTLNYDNKVKKLIDSIEAFNKLFECNLKVGIEYDSNTSNFLCTVWDTNGGKFIFFKDHEFKFNIITHKDYEIILDLVKKARLNISNNNKINQ